MKYKGFLITASYIAGSDFKIDRHDRVIDRKPTSKDIEYYEILDPVEGMRRQCAEFTIEECKKTIDDLLKTLKMKSNLKREWDKLDTTIGGKRRCPSSQ